MSNKKLLGKMAAAVAVLAAGALALAGCVDAWARMTLPLAVGDIILKDGSVRKPADYVEGSDTAAAVIVRAASDGVPSLGVGIKKNKSVLAWCTREANGYGTNITDLRGDVDSGFMDGSTGLEKLKAACADANTSLDNYPAWQFCADYGATNNLTGDLANGWYLPTLAELNTIYQNKETVEASLTKAGGETFASYVYWSSCQDNVEASVASGLNFDSGVSYNHSSKGNPTYVCSVRAFN